MNNQITEQEIDKLVEQRLCSMMRENSPKLLQFLTLQAGIQCVEANAGTLELGLHADIQGGRYKVKNVITVERIGDAIGKRRK